MTGQIPVGRDAQINAEQLSLANPQKFDHIMTFDARVIVIASVNGAGTSEVESEVS